jgi:hypothetical protein
MAILVWTMVGLALWHFTIFLPDQWWAGIVGAFIGAVLGAILFGLLINGFSIPSRDDTSLVTGLEGIPGTLIGLAAVWFLGVRQERAAEAHRPLPR